MLELKGVDHELTSVLPGLQRIHLRLAGFRGGTVPALKLDGRRVQGSHSIARALERLRPEPPLFPAEASGLARVEEAERWGDEELQPVPRIILRWGLVRHAGLRRWLAQNAGLPAPGLAALLSVPAAWYYARVVAADQDRPSGGRSPGLGPMLDQADALLADGVLAPGEPNAATLQVLSSVRALDAFADLHDQVAAHHRARGAAPVPRLPRAGAALPTPGTGSRRPPPAPGRLLARDDLHHRHLLARARVGVDDVGAGTAAEPRRLVGLADEDSPRAASRRPARPRPSDLRAGRPRHDRRGWRRRGPGRAGAGRVTAARVRVGAPAGRRAAHARTRAPPPRDGPTRRRWRDAHVLPPHRRRAGVRALRRAGRGARSTTPTRSPTGSAGCWRRTAGSRPRTGCPGPTATASTCCTSPGAPVLDRRARVRPGQRTPIHDHIAWCVVGVCRASSARPAPAGRGAPDRHLQPIDVVEARRGHVERSIPPAEDIHLVEARGDELTISIHVYGADIERRGTSIHRRFDDVPELSLAA